VHQNVESGVFAGKSREDFFIFLLEGGARMGARRDGSHVLFVMHVPFLMLLSVGATFVRISTLD
jgi:hypothetical protein